ncbi:hypothetical protein LCGC14_1941490 [marine sediment metagenome]|uniref:Glycosyltransferase 2-like domain-containing protein n=1 Tax=marine sediment metagenome TaxID=412755 RepID=A0A0F9IHG2_9ZZZZ
MKLLHDSRHSGGVDLSIVLTDWSCRESFHVLDYLANQSWPREKYEVLWVEYYDARPAGIQRRMAQARMAGGAPPVDAHLLLEVPRNVHYHKHLMYNAGLLLARGRIVCICDSDAIVRPTFVESIVRAFEETGGNIVLHLDQVRNTSRRFYPFNRPSMEQVIGPGCINWINGRPAGLSDTRDTLHVRNYGACMAARREDLIAIGGADEHIDYLGHICGPYEMTFRLVHAGRSEQWHQGEWLYHVWHPGQAGQGERLGPHDGRHVSTAALEARASGRTRPLEEDPAIACLRSGQVDRPVEELLAMSLDPDRLSRWRKERLHLSHRSPEQPVVRPSNSANIAVTSPPLARYSACDRCVPVLRSSSFRWAHRAVATASSPMLRWTGVCMTSVM